MDALTCPRKLPDTGQRCDQPLARGARYGPCPTCVADIARRHDHALFARNCKVAQALADGYEINEANEFALPAVEVVEEVIASDRAGAPSRRAGGTGGTGPRPPSGTDTSRARALRAAKPGTQRR